MKEEKEVIIINLLSHIGKHCLVIRDTDKS